jgi:hypothetical protein
MALALANSLISALFRPDIGDVGNELGETVGIEVVGDSPRLYPTVSPLPQ